MPTSPRDTDQNRGHYALLPGTLAYVDTFNGLIPCKITEVRGPGDVSFVVTADRPAWKRGETDSVQHNDVTSLVIPRTAVYTRGGKLRIAHGTVIAYPSPSAIAERARAERAERRAVGQR